MARPDQRPMHRLPTLEARRAELETCVFCPKLCRTACPVSNVEPTETLIPWGKMTAAYLVAHGDVPANESFARTSLACTGCYACRELCDHKNDVTGTLFAARSAEAKLGILPASAMRVARDFPEHLGRARLAARDLASLRGVRASSRTGLLVGCMYARKARPEAEDAVNAAGALVSGGVSVLEECCGLPLLHAGDADGFARHAKATAKALSRFDRLVVVDPGCAVALRQRYPEVSAAGFPKAELLVEVAAENLPLLTPEARPPEAPVRYHDPCQLGRGLGVYDAPRQILGRITGGPPGEMTHHGSKAGCSGAGGLLPVTMPETARQIAKGRQEEHARSGGGEIVTACASSLLSLRKAGPAPVSDLVTWIARALPQRGS